MFQCKNTKTDPNLNTNPNPYPKLNPNPSVYVHGQPWAICTVYGYAHGHVILCRFVRWRCVWLELRLAGLRFWV